MGEVLAVGGRRFAKVTKAACIGRSQCVTQRVTNQVQMSKYKGQSSTKGWVTTCVRRFRVRSLTE